MIALAFLLTASFAADQESQPSPAQVRETFRQPPKRYRPMVRWFWPGGDVKDAQLVREIGLLDEAHFGGVEIQPFRVGLDPKAPADVLRRVHDYRTPSFFSHMRAAMTEAARRGMWVDYTMGSGWPFGGGMAITPELVQLELRLAHQSVAGGRPFSGTIPWPKPPPGFGTFVAKLTGTDDPLPNGWVDRLAARERLVAVVAMRGSAAVVDTTSSKDLIGNPARVVTQRGSLDLGSTIVLTSRVRPDRTLDWVPPKGDWQLFVMVQAPADQRVLGGVGGPQLVADHLDRRAIEAHFAAVGDSAVRYLREFAGNTWRGIFIDSLELAAELCWTDAFLAHFRRLRGYDLTPFLPLLDTAYDAAQVGERIRHDYDLTVADLLAKETYGPFAEWATRHGMISRIQGHDAPADQARLYSFATIPETENLHGGGRYDLLKLASSTAHSYGRSITSAEAFVWIMEEYQTTPEKMKRQADELIAAGVNQIVASGFPHEYMDRAEPGWYPFVSPFPYASHLNHRDPFWRFMRPLNEYLTRLQYLSQVGQTVTPVAVLQTELAFSHRPADAPVVRLVRHLVGAGYDFDYMNGPAILASRVVGGRLTSPGGARYDALVMVDTEQLSAGVAVQLAAFARAGLPIVVAGKRPGGQPGYRGHRVQDRQVVASMASMERRQNVRFVASQEEAVAHIKASVIPNVSIEGAATSINVLEKRIGPLDLYFFRNGSTDAARLMARFPRAQGGAERWDPWTGTVVPLAPADRGDGAPFAVDLEPLGSALIVFDRTTRPLAPQAAVVAGPVRVVEIGGVSAAWRFEAEGRIGRGGETRVTRPASPLFDWASDPELQDFSGRGSYAIEFEVDADLVGTRVELDLGQVRDVAELTVNGTAGPTLLMRPYRADVTALLKPGTNILRVTVTNPPLNRLIGAGMKLGMLFAEGYARPPKRLPAGLLGPVRLLIARR